MSMGEDLSWLEGDTARERCRDAYDDVYGQGIRLLDLSRRVIGSCEGILAVPDPTERRQLGDALLAEADGYKERAQKIAGLLDEVAPLGNGARHFELMDTDSQPQHGVDVFGFRGDTR